MAPAAKMASAPAVRAPVDPQRTPLQGHGWSGASCEEPPRCPGAPLPCSGRGECLAGGVCRCQAQAAGPDCFADANHSAVSVSRSFFARRMESLLSMGTAAAET